MEAININKNMILRGSAAGVSDVNDRIVEIFSYFQDLLPKKPEALILLKPNLNNDLGGLTGTTTDLRLLVAVIKELKKRGYHNLIIGDGSNCGIFHSRINTFKRLCIDVTAKMFDIKYVDFNRAETKKVDLFANSALAAAVAVDCDFFINLPKIKTHTEASMSLSCKNMVGCFAGYQKRNVHSRFHQNIHLLPKIFKPQLHILDGLVAMEGNGPGAGKPVQLNMIFAATDPYLLDAYIAQLVGIPFRNIPYLKVALEQGDIDQGEQEALAKVDREFDILRPEMVAWKNFLLSNWFVKPRYWKIFDWMFNNRFVDWLLLTLKIRQDIFINSDAELRAISVDHGKCPEDCDRCEQFCPLSIALCDPSVQLSDKNCINCLYCYFVCPHGAIKVTGELGYLKNHIARYKKAIEEL